MAYNCYKLTFYAFIFGLFTLYSKSDAACNTCSEKSNAMCLNATAYKICVDGKNPSSGVKHCPANTRCTDKEGICLPKDAAEPDGCPLKECNVCSGNFMCMSKNHYGVCGTTGIVIADDDCPDGEVCSMENFLSPKKSICGKECDITTPTCSNTELTTVPTTTASYKDTCSGKQTTGNYPLKGDSTSCPSDFVHCEILDGEMTSFLKTCKPGYFDSVNQKCVVKKPVNCV